MAARSSASEAAATSQRVLGRLERAPRLRFGADALERIAAAIAAYPELPPLEVAAEAVARSRGGYRQTDGPQAFLDFLRYRREDERKIAAQVDAITDREARQAPAQSSQRKDYDRCLGRHPFATRRPDLTGCAEPLTTHRERQAGCCDGCDERFTDALLAAQERANVEFYGPRGTDGRFQPRVAVVE